MVKTTLESVTVDRRGKNNHGRKVKKNGGTSQCRSQAPTTSPTSSLIKSSWQPPDFSDSPPTQLFPLPYLHSSDIDLFAEAQTYQTCSSLGTFALAGPLA